MLPTVSIKTISLILALDPENPGSSLQKLSLPVRDLIGMGIKQLAQFGHRLLALQRHQRHLRFGCRRVVPACTLRHIVQIRGIIGAFR